jgi:hypothetical protein
MPQGVRLDEAYSLSALQLALDELPQAWAEQARRDPKGMFIKVCCNLLNALRHEKKPAWPFVDSVYSHAVQSTC